jgi:single-strand DNA-binding protein
MSTRSWNKVELIGNLTRDPELRYTPSGAAVCTFSIATNRTYVTEGEKREEADFHRCVAWNKLAELCSQLMKKGNKVFISGRLQNRSWEGQDGQSRQTTEIVVEDMLLLTSKSESSGDFPDEIPTRNEPVPAAAPKSTPKPATPPPVDAPAPKEDPGDLDDLPF